MNKYQARRACDEVDEMCSLVEEGEWAEHIGRTELGSKVELMLTKLIGEIQQLKAERAALLQDKARLDYMIRQEYDFSGLPDSEVTALLNHAREEFDRWGAAAFA